MTDERSYRWADLTPREQFLDELVRERYAPVLPRAIRPQPVVRPGEPEFGRREPGDTAMWFGPGEPERVPQRHPGARPTGTGWPT